MNTCTGFANYSQVAFESASAAHNFAECPLQRTSSQCRKVRGSKSLKPLEKTNVQLRSQRINPRSWRPLSSFLWSSWAQVQLHWLFDWLGGFFKWPKFRKPRQKSHAVRSLAKFASRQIFLQLRLVLFPHFLHLPQVLGAIVQDDLTGMLFLRPGNKTKTTKTLEVPTCSTWGRKDLNRSRCLAKLWSEWLVVWHRQKRQALNMPGKMHGFLVSCGSRWQRVSLQLSKKIRASSKSKGRLRYDVQVLSSRSTSTSSKSYKHGSQNLIGQ